MVSINDWVSPLNGAVAALLRSPLHFIASRGLMVVEWSGRRSGRPFAIPVGYQEHEGGLIVLLSKPSEKNWWKNFRTPWPARVWVRGKHRAVTGEVIPAGSAAFFPPIEGTLRRLPWMGSQFGGVRYDANRGLDDEQRAVLSKHVGAVRFEFSDADAGRD